MPPASPAISSSGRIQPAGYISSNRPPTPNGNEPGRRTATGGYPRPSETSGYPTGSHRASESGYLPPAGSGPADFGPTGYGANGANGGFGSPGSTGGFDVGRLSSGYESPASGFGPTGSNGSPAAGFGSATSSGYGPSAPVDRRSVESGYVAPVARPGTGGPDGPGGPGNHSSRGSHSERASGGGRRHRAEGQPPWQDSYQQQSGSHARPDLDTDAPSGSHATGRSVSELIASNGGTAGPRRRRRRQD
jgi:hypothetical protein